MTYHAGIVRNAPNLTPEENNELLVRLTALEQLVQQAARELALIEEMSQTAPAIQRNTATRMVRHAAALRREMESKRRIIRNVFTTGKAFDRVAPGTPRARRSL